MFSRRLLPYFQGEGLKARLARGAAGAFSINVAGLGLTLLLNLVLARTIGPEGLGIYAYVTAWIVILVLGAKLGLEQTLLRFVAEYQARENWALLRAVIRYAERRVVVFGLAIAGIGVVVVLALADQASDTLSRTFLIGLAMIPPLALLQTRSAVARGLGLVASALLPYAVVRPATVVVAVGICALWSWSSGTLVVATEPGPSVRNDGHGTWDSPGPRGCHGEDPKRAPAQRERCTYRRCTPRLAGHDVAVAPAGCLSASV